MSDRDRDERSPALAKGDGTDCPGRDSPHYWTHLARPDCPHHLEHLVNYQAEEIRNQAQRIRELHKERAQALSREEAALDLAEQYARKTGVNISRDDVLKYVEQYWESRGQWEKRMTTLETFHWDVFAIERDLAAALSDGRAKITDAHELAQRLVTRIRGINQGVARGKGSELFPRPQAPTGSGTEALFELEGGVS